MFRHQTSLASVGLQMMIVHEANNLNISTLNKAFLGRASMLTEVKTAENEKPYRTKVLKSNAVPSGKRTGTALRSKSAKPKDQKSANAQPSEKRTGVCWHRCQPINQVCHLRAAAPWPQPRENPPSRWGPTTARRRCTRRALAIRSACSASRTSPCRGSG